MQRDATPLTITTYTTLVHSMPHIPVSERTRGQPHEKGVSLLIRCLDPCCMSALHADHDSRDLRDARARNAPGAPADSLARALQREHAQREGSHGPRMPFAHDRVARRPRDHAM